MKGLLPPRRVSFVLACLLGVCLTVPLGAQQPIQPPVTAASRTAVIHGVATTQGGTIRLPGVTVVVEDASGAMVATTVTEGEGTYRLAGLPPGPKTVVFTLEGFDAVRRPIDPQAGQDLEVSGDLDIAKVTETLEVVQETYAEPMAMTLGSREALDEKSLKSGAASGGSIDAALSMLAGVVFGPEGLSIRGGRPSQSVMLVGGTDMSDASVGTTRYQLPSEAVATVEVLPNPYAVEFGRFSSGVTILNLRRGTDTWRASINNLDPGFHGKRGRPWVPTGVRVWAPHAAVGGPLIKDRLFLAQTNHFDYRSDDIESRPQGERTSRTQWSSFTRLDANLGTGHTGALTLGIFPEKRTAANLNTFTPPDSTFDVRQRVYNLGVSDARTLSSTRVVELSTQVSHYSVQVDGRGDLPMVLQPRGVSGSYFNRQGRRTDALQVLATLSDFKPDWLGEHLFKVGVDLLQSRYDGESSSLPVQIRRDDGTLARLITFSDASHIETSSTDLGVFLQDRWRPVPRLLFELGVRLDRDGALESVNFTPRSGVALLLKPDGSITLRGGAGLFYERTPLVARAFTLLENRTETRYAADGVTPLAAPIRYANQVDGPLRTPASTTWNIEYSHRLNASWSFRASHLERRGNHELIVNPVVDGTWGVLAVSSSGRSSYRESEVSGRYTSGRDFEVSLSYLHSHAVADLNNYASYFGADRNPVIGQNEYGRTPSDVPHRLVARLRAVVADDWAFASFAEIRSGFPYSAVDEAQDFVGRRNAAGRYPAVALLNVGVERRINLGKWSPWVGVKVSNILNYFAPRDVQSNVASLQYGGFYNPIPREVRLSLRID